jgi:hypothetical protein
VFEPRPPAPGERLQRRRPVALQPAHEPELQRLRDEREHQQAEEQQAAGPRVKVARLVEDAVELRRVTRRPAPDERQNEQRQDGGRQKPDEREPGADVPAEADQLDEAHCGKSAWPGWRAQCGGCPAS